MTRFRVFLMGLCCALGILSAGPGSARRLALVVGIDSYQNVTPLLKAANDARAMGGALQASGFEVMTGVNLGRRDFFMALNDLYNRIQPGDEVVFFFAGHGVLLEGRNRLLPSDVPVVEPGNETLLAYESIAADEIMADIQRRGARLTFMILDACRNNPFPTSGQRSVGQARGLGRMDPPEGAFVLYSAGTGQTALDRLSNADGNPNSVFTRSLLPLMQQPGLSLPAMARQVRDDVRALAQSVNHAQFPAYYDQLSGDFFFRPADRGSFSMDAAPAAAAPSAIPAPTTVPAISDPCAGAAGTWEIIQSSSSASVFGQYLQSYGDCPIFAALANERMQQLQAAAASTTNTLTPPSGARVGTGSLGLGTPTQPAAVAPPQALTPSASPVPSGDACFDLWYRRNEIFQSYGYCFQTDKAKRYFDTSSCTTRSPQLSAPDLSRVEAIRAQERAAGC